VGPTKEKRERDLALFLEIWWDLKLIYESFTFEFLYYEFVVFFSWDLGYVCCHGTSVGKIGGVGPCP
jgi:hypothetical protein